ncbi:hypothetical protein PV646_20635 [Streptomyces sp. ID05-26A]|nr:hypothetical protein [Streptomyces sp. ID05-26A]
MGTAGTDLHRQILGMVAELPENASLRTDLRRACLGCATRTGAVSTIVYLTTGRGTLLPLETSGPLGEEIAELQTVLQEGPSSTANQESWPVFVPRLADSVHTSRWPLFAPAAAAAGVAGLVAVPLTLGALSLGTVEVHNDSGKSLRPHELADVLLLANEVTSLLLERPAGAVTMTSER